jgi:hypothetical protein
MHTTSLAPPQQRLIHYNPANEVLLGKIDPIVFARSVGEGMRAGVRSVIEACVHLRDGDRLFEADPSLHDQFVRALVDENVIPKRSARLGNVAKSKFSMLRKIGECANFLLDDEIFRFLEPGYSILYHVIRLHEDLPGDHQERTARLVRLFEAQGSLSREFLIEQIDLVNRAREANAVEAPDPWDKGSVHRFDLVLMTPVQARDIRRLGENYGDRAPRCLSLRERVAKDAICIVIGRIVDLPAIENKLLPGSGFASISRVLLPQEPLISDVTESQVVVIATRGRLKDLCIDRFEWLPRGQALDFLSLASQLAPSAKNRVRLFAPAKCDGWCTIVGEANWEPADE